MARLKYYSYTADEENEVAASSSNLTEEIDEAQVPVAVGSDEGTTPRAEEVKYVLSRRRCLHIEGRCRATTSPNIILEPLGTHKPDKTSYAATCLLCWPNLGDVKTEFEWRAYVFVCIFFRKKNWDGACLRESLRLSSNPNSARSRNGFRGAADRESTDVVVVCVGVARGKTCLGFQLASAF